VTAQLAVHVTGVAPTVEKHDRLLAAAERLRKGIARSRGQQQAGTLTAHIDYFVCR
jgi:hypothetical protein